MHTHTHSHKQTHTHTHAYTRTYTHTYTHTHTYTFRPTQANAHIRVSLLWQRTSHKTRLNFSKSKLGLTKIYKILYFWCYVAFLQIYASIIYLTSYFNTNSCKINNLRLIKIG